MAVCDMVYSVSRDTAVGAMKKTCSVDGCNRRHRAYGMCRVHYARWYRTGSTKRTQRNYGDGRPLIVHAVEKMLARVTKTEAGCWIVSGSSRSGGYRDVSINRGDSGTTRWLAHRLSYEHFKGCTPKGMLVCHSCDNRACVNPDHLFLGTYATNLHDMATKGRSLYGERANNVKLTEKDVQQVYEMRERGLSYREIGEQFGVTYGCIHMICAGHNWKRSYQRFRASAPEQISGNTPRPA